MTQTAAERAIDYIKRAGSSTPRELEDRLGLAQKDQYAYFKHAIEVGALVKHKDALGRIAYCLGPSVDVFNPLRTRKKKPQRPVEHVGKQIEAKNSGAHALPIAAQCDGAPQTKPEVINNRGSLGGASYRITPRQDEAGDERHRTKAGLLAYAERSRRDSFKREAKEGAVPGQNLLQHREDRPESAYDVTKRNKRSVWTIATESYSEAHFATFPQALVEPCILAGSRPGDIVFDPFMGSGTVAQVVQRLGRRWLGAELNPAYIELQRGRVQQFGLELHSTEQTA